MSTGQSFRPAEPLETIVARCASEGGGLAHYLRTLEQAYVTTAGYCEALAELCEYRDLEDMGLELEPDTES